MGDKISKFLGAVALVAMAFSVPAMASKLKDQSGSDAPLGQRSILSPAKIAKRIAPEAKVCLEGEACGEATAAAAPAVASAPKTPEELYTGTCSACHGVGVLGAPVPGKADQWAARIAQGTDTLYKHAIGGFNSMPAKGGCAACSDDEIKAVVDYMVNQSK